MSEDPRARLVAALAATRRRLSLRAGLVAGAGAAVGGVVLLELAWSLGARGEGLALLCGGCAAAGAVAAGLAARRAAPSPGLAAALLDELLGRGATLATAAEALDGAHPRFAPALLAEADRALVAVDLRRLLPLRAPAGLLLAGAVAVLWGALLPSARAEAAPPGAPRPRTPLVALLGGGAGPAEPDALPPDPSPGEVVAVAQAPEGSPDPAADLAARSPEAAALLLEQLEAALARAGVTPRADATGASAPGTTPAAEPRPDVLDAALARGDLAAARAALERLAEAAGRGDRAARARLAELGDELGGGPAGSGSGGADDAAPTGQPPAGPASAPGSAPDAGRVRRPWALDATARRYFDADPLRSRPARGAPTSPGAGR